MYIRKVKTKNKQTGAEYFTYHLVKNIREQGVPKQINLISMGKLEGVNEQDLSLLSKRIEELYHRQPVLFSTGIAGTIEELAYFFSQKLIQKGFVERQITDADYQEFPQSPQYVEIDINSITGERSEQIGGEFFCKQAIQELNLDSFLKEELKYTDTQLNNSMIALIGRLLYSSNENQTVRWLNDNSGIQEFYPLESGKVNKNQLYSAANQLYQDKEAIEKFMNQRVEKIFDLTKNSTI